MRLRLTFAKEEPLRYLGHLDIHRALERTIRRADLPVRFSQGYNPRIVLQIAAALPLGCTGEAELLDLWLERPLPPEQALRALQAASPSGLSFCAVEEVPENAPSLPTLVRAAEYRVRFLDPVDDLPERVANLLAQGHLWRTKPGKKGPRRYDLRPIIEALQATPEGELWMRLRALPGETGRPDEVLQALGLDPALGLPHRTRLLLAPDLVAAA